MKGRAHPEGLRYRASAEAACEVVHKAFPRKRREDTELGFAARLSDPMRLRPNPSRPGRRAGPTNRDVMKSFVLSDGWLANIT